MAIGSRLRHVIESQQPVEEHQGAVRRLQIVFRQVRQFFQLAYGIMREEPDRAGGERRESGKMGRRVLAQKAIQHAKDAALDLLYLSMAFQHDLLSAGAQHHVGPGAKKGIPADLLSAFD